MLSPVAVPTRRPQGRDARRQIAISRRDPVVQIDDLVSLVETRIGISLVSGGGTILSGGEEWRPRRCRTGDRRCWRILGAWSWRRAAGRPCVGRRPTHGSSRGG